MSQSRCVPPASRLDSNSVHASHRFFRNAVGAIVASVLIASCSLDRRTTVIPGPQSVRRPAAGSSLYVLNAASVTVYDLSGKLIRAITDGIASPVAFGLDASGNLYVANHGDGGASSISVYTPGSMDPARSITLSDQPTALAVDSAGDLFVASQSMVSVFTSGAASAGLTIVDGIDAPYRLALDSAGDMDVLNTFPAHGSVTTYARNATSPTRTITGAFRFPSALAIDRSGDIYVGNGGKRAIYVFGAGPTPIRKYTSGIDLPRAIIFDRKDRLYVANQNGPTVTVYEPGETTPHRTLRDLVSPYALALDSSDNLYVADTTLNAVNVYGRRSKTPLLTIRKGLSKPIALAFGP